jgi:hypothetical protein
VGLLVEGFGQVKVKDTARQIRPCCFICFYLHSVGVGNVMCGIASSPVTIHHPLLCFVPCQEPVVGAVAEVLEVDLALERATHPRWVSHMLIYKPCQGSKALFILYVVILHHVCSF